MKNKSTPWPPNQYIPLAHTVQNVRDIYKSKKGGGILLRGPNGLYFPRVIDSYFRSKLRKDLLTLKSE